MIKCNIMIVGVGGQGTLLASRILGKLASDKNLDCKLSEVHGMAQRGGSVVTFVKMGEKIHSPIIDEGEADIILSFEKLEAVRYINYLKKGGTVIVNTQQIYPMPVITGKCPYPNDILSEIENTCKVIKLDALKIAEEIKNPKSVNVVMIGKLAKTMGITFEDIKKAVESTVPQKTLEGNLEALKRGYNL